MQARVRYLKFVKLNHEIYLLPPLGLKSVLSNVITHSSTFKYLFGFEEHAAQLIRALPSGMCHRAERQRFQFRPAQ